MQNIILFTFHSFKDYIANLHRFTVYLLPASLLRRLHSAVNRKYDSYFVWLLQANLMDLTWASGNLEHCNVLN